MTRKLFQIYSPDSLTAGMSRVECRTRAEELREQEQAERHVALSELSSSALGPMQRISMWEKLHQARLPSESNHPVLQVIAANTGLSLDEIGAEQRRRLGAARA